jgi:hypothetical protein
MRSLALALVSLAILPLQPASNQDDYRLKDGTICHQEGTAQSAKAQLLNRHKNRYRHPSVE